MENLWEQVGNECLKQAFKILKEDTAKTEATVMTVKTLVDIAISIDMLNLHWKAKNCPRAENKGGKLCNIN